MELFENLSFYANHPLLQSLYETKKEYYKSLKTIYEVAVSSKATGNSLEGLVKSEALRSCKPGEWGSFMCLLALSSVTKRNIYSVYPSVGAIRTRIILNNLVTPRTGTSLGNMHIMFTQLGFTEGKSFNPNHFVPLSNMLKKVVVPKISTGKEKNKRKQEGSQKSSQLKLDKFISKFQNDEASHSQRNNGVELQTDVESKSDVFDLETYIDMAEFKDLSEGLDFPEKLKLSQRILHPPDKSYKFPYMEGKERRCQHSWFQLYPWLRYSFKENKLYCIACSIYGDEYNKTKSSNIVRFYKEPVKDMSTATKTMKSHIAGQGMHSVTMSKYLGLIQDVEKDKGIRGLTKPKSKKSEEKDNEKILSSIIEAIIFLGRQCLPLRGHEDSIKNHPSFSMDVKNNAGNFLELLYFIASKGDNTLKNHLEKKCKNAMYTSAPIQNELIFFCGEYIRDELLAEIKKNNFYAILADEAADCSTKSQMAIVLRFVDCQGNIREEFLEFAECKYGLKGEGLEKLILEVLKKFGLDIKNCRGQGYDGAGSVAGKDKGLAARIIKNHNRWAVYVHCWCHQLNLCVQSSCEVRLVENAFSTIKELTYFFNFSTPRRNVLIKQFSKFNKDLKKMVLTDPCRTRWIERLDGLDDFFLQYVPVVRALEEMELNEGEVVNRESSQKSSGLVANATKFEFIVSFVIAKKVLDYTYGITKMLQSKSMDLPRSIPLIRNLKSTIQAVRENIDEYHN